MGFSRLVLGMHSLNQVLYGFQLGLWTLAFVLTTGQPVLFSNLQRIRRKIKHNESVSKYILILTGITGVMMAIDVGNYFWVDSVHGFELDPKWKANIHSCRPEPVSVHRVKMGNIKAMGTLLAALGAYSGFVTRLQRGITRDVQDIFSNKCIVIFGLTMKIAIVVAVSGSIYYLGASMEDAHPLVQMLIETAIPCFLLTFGCTCGFEILILNYCFNPDEPPLHKVEMKHGQVSGTILPQSNAMV